MMLLVKVEQGDIAHMTSAQRGERGLAKIMRIVLIGCVSVTVTAGKGPNPQNFAQVTNEWHLLGKSHMIGSLHDFKVMLEKGFFL